jgi:hypothetical protein
MPWQGMSISPAGAAVAGVATGAARCAAAALSMAWHG